MNDDDEPEKSSEKNKNTDNVRPSVSDRGLELNLQMKAMLAAVEPSPAVKAILAAAEPRPAIKAMLAAVEPIPAVKAMLASVEPSPAVKAMLAGVGPSPALKAMFASVEPSAAVKAMLAGAGPSPAVKAMFAAVEPSAAVKAMLAGAGLSPGLKAMIDGIQSFTDSPAINALAGLDLSLSPGKWGLPSSTTLNEVLQELAGRAAESDAPDQPPAEAESESHLIVSDHAYLEVVQAAPSAPALKLIPTWVMVIWLWILCPSLLLIVHWQSAREGLADLNARLPQTETLKGIREFIRKELTGKPGDIRIVTGANVHLRVGPGMKSEVLLHLPKESIVVVLGKVDRTWVFVSYEHQGYLIDGYVSHTYLQKVN